MHALKQAISSAIESSRVARIARNNRNALASIIRSLIFCGKQNIALGGHRESQDSDKNRGNFLALLADFRGQAGDEVLANHLRTCSRNATYASPTIQNDVITIIGEH